MKFYSLDKKIANSYDAEVILKVEYFWHFWDFLFTTNRELILVNESKFVSQLSLLNKIEKHLKYNRGINSKKLLKYSEHDYFKKENLLLRGNPLLIKKIKSFKASIQQFNDDRNSIITSIEDIKSTTFAPNNFSDFLLRKLKKLILSNKTLESTKSDLKFLCNSIIDILLIKGYSVFFIKNLLKNIILNPNGKDRFNYQKNRTDFQNNIDYDEYIESEFKKINLEKRINYLSHFLKQSKNKGYHIFKIEGIEFNNDPIEIFEVKFYNPKKNKFLTSFDNNDKYAENINYYPRRELFHSERDIFNETICEDSTCNAIVPIEYHKEDINFDQIKKVPISYKEAIDKVQFSLNLLKNSISFSSYGYWEKDIASIKPSLISILTNSNYCYHSTCETEEKNKIIFELDDVRKRMFNKKLSFLNSINIKNNFLLQLSKSHSALANYRVNFYFFDFKSIWIDCIEPFFKDYDELINIANKAVEYRSNIFKNYQSLFSNALEHYPFHNNYSLNDTDLEIIGISSLEVGQEVTGEKLFNNYNLLPELSIIREFKDEMEQYKNSSANFKKKISDWITNSIKSAYDERNIEVHYNLKDYYMDYGLKRDLIKIVSIVIGALTDSVYNTNATNISEAILYINNKLR